MDIKLLKASISSNTIPDFLIFIEKNSALCKQYLKSISNTLDKKLKYYDTVDNVLYDLDTNIMDTNNIFVIRNDEKVLKNESYVSTIKNSKVNVILIYDDIDKKSKFYKEFFNHIVEFEKLDKYVILAYLQNKLNESNINIEQDKILTLIDYCNCDLGICLNELDKIITLNKENSNMLCDYMLNNGFSDYRKTDVFKFVDDILNNNTIVYENRQRLEEQCITLLMIIYNKAKYRFINTKIDRYLHIMKTSFNLYSKVLNGSINNSYAISYLLSVFVK